MRVILFLFIITSTLGAQTTWYPIETGTDIDLSCIDFVNDQVGYIGGEHILLKTIDGGVTWQEVTVITLDTNNNDDWVISDIQFFTESHGRIVLGQWQGMAETFDGGATWTSTVPISSGFCQFGSIYYFDADQGLAGGAGCFESSIIDRFDNGTWSLTSIPPTFDTQDLVTNFDFIDLDNGLACTSGGRILRTTDGGSNWDTIPNPESMSAFTDIAYFTADIVYATFSRQGGFGTLVSIDAGITWDIDWETATFYYPLMNAVHVNGAGVPFFAGLNGNDLTTGVIFDRGIDFWNYQSLEFPIQDIDSHSDSVTFLVGDSGAVYVNVDPLLLGVDELDSSIQLYAYPNPASEWINISVNARAHEVMDVRMFDLRGKEIRIAYSSTDYGIPIQLQDIPNGQYLIEVITDKGRNVIPFQKE